MKRISYTKAKKMIISTVSTIRGYYSEKIFPYDIDATGCDPARIARIICDNILKELRARLKELEDKEDGDE